MARMRTIQSIEEKIQETESKFVKAKERCDRLAQELEDLYEEKRRIEEQELLDAIRESSRSKAEILAFLESKV